MIKEFSVAQRVNISIKGECNQKCKDFINLIYKNFEPAISNPKFSLNVNIIDDLPKVGNKTTLGKDGYFNDDTLVLKTGHFFIRKSKDALTVGVPLKVKRGRVPFKRETSGRHITDEIIEPLLQLCLLKCSATFVHASSIYEDEKVKVLMGWRGTGKTNAILEDFEKKEIWSDDLSIIDTEGFVYPYLRPIRIYSYNLPLLNESYVKNNKLKRKKLLTPPWRPVHYLPLNKTKSSKGVLGDFIYLNNVKNDSLETNAQDIMEFEQIFFKNYELMLKHSGVFISEISVKSVLESAFHERGICKN
jgi:hypothetical protein